MMKKVIFCFFVIIITTISSNMYAQNKIEIRDNQLAIGLNLGGPLVHVPFKMETTTGESVDINKRSFPIWNKNREKSDWYSNFDVGIEVVLIRPRSHIGAFLDLNYRNWGFRMKYPDEEENYTKHIAQYIAPALGLRVLTGSYKNYVRGYIEGGAAYNFKIHYKGSYNGNLNAINNGCTLLAGLGCDLMPGSPNPVSAGIKYSYDLYDFFNNKFSPDEINKPYSGFKSKMGYISLKIITYIRVH